MIAQQVKGVVINGIVVPAHIELRIEHNPHAADYMSVGEWLSQSYAKEMYEDSFEDDEARQKCIDNNELWSLQIYENSPNGFVFFAGPTLDDVVRMASINNSLDSGD